MANKMEIGQTLYACGYKTRKVSFREDLITGLKILKPTIKRITEKYIILNVGKLEQRISKNRIGKSIFLTEKEVVEFIINETRERIKEKENAKRKQHLDLEHLKSLKRDLKKWEKYALVSGGDE